MCQFHSLFCALCVYVSGPTVALSSRDHRPVSTTSQGSSQGNKAAAAATASTALQLQLHEVIGSGTFGVVYRATWRGIPAAVKVVQLPGGSDNVGRGGGRRQSRREQMAVMETALGSSLSHPNIVQASVVLCLSFLVHFITQSLLCKTCISFIHFCCSVF